MTCKNPVHSDTGRSVTIDLPASIRVLDISTAPETFRKINTGQHDAWYIQSLNISYCEISGFPNAFFKPLIRLKIIDLSYNRIQRLNSRMFETQSNLERFILVGNAEALTFESDVFFGTTSLKSLEMKDLSITRITRTAFASESIKVLEIYDSVIEQMDDYFLESSSIEYLLLNGSRLKTFTETMFHAASKIRLLVTDEHKFCCVRPSYLPEDNCLPHKNEFSSCNDLINNDVLRILVWVVAGFIILANCISIGNRIKDTDRAKSCFGIFASNLAVSDILIGIYLIIIAAADTSFRGIYIFQDELWRQGMFCKIASALSVTACENSALFISLITLERYLVIKYPFRKQIITHKIGVALSCVVWVLGIFAALIPIVFIEGGLYSQTGICLALPVTRAKFEGWGYSFGLFVVFNLLVCLMVAFGQWSIYKEIQESAKTLAGSKSKSSKTSRAAWKLLLVSLSDFLCRFPVSLLGR